MRKYLIKQMEDKKYLCYDDFRQRLKEEDELNKK